LADHRGHWLLSSSDPSSICATMNHPNALGAAARRSPPEL
jgi:hypothetical protein